jgi:hypothetical protein
MAGACFILSVNDTIFSLTKSLTIKTTKCVRFAGTLSQGVIGEQESKIVKLPHKGRISRKACDALRPETAKE